VATGGAATPRRIVVGVDGSETAELALAWAVGEAQRSGASLTLLAAWMFPMVVGYAFTSTVDSVRQGAIDLVEHSLARVAELAPDVSVKGETSEEPPQQALVEASAGADLLVVGSRGLGGFKGLLLGSVSQYCARHARCPVVIVR